MSARIDRRPVGFLLGMLALMLLVLPFITTFDDLLTGIALHLGLDHAVQAVVPLEARMVVGLLVLIHLPAAAYGSQIVFHGAAYSQPLPISWNCTGWQSLLILGASFVVGFRGGGWERGRVPLMAVGLAGTLLLNILRIATVCLIAASAGYVPAILFHDYGGMLMVIAWLLLFWTLAQRWRVSGAMELRE